VTAEEIDRGRAIFESGKYAPKNDANEVPPVDPPPDDNGNVDSDAGAAAAGWLSDTNISKLLVNRLLRGKYCWTKGFGWMAFDGKKWVPTPDQDVTEQSRLFATDLVANVVAAQADPDKIRAYVRRLTAGAVRAAAELAKGNCWSVPPTSTSTPTYSTSPTVSLICVPARSGHTIPRCCSPSARPPNTTPAPPTSTGIRRWPRCPTT
jgi:hypothetical protein